MKVKELSDTKLIQLGDDFSRLNLKDRDNVIFNFEADTKKMLKNINLNKLIKKDKKYLKNVKKFIKQIVLQSYLIDIINVGNKKASRYSRYYVNK